MPQLPVYNSQRNIAANPVAPQQTGAEQPYIDQQKVLSTVADISSKWQQAQDVMQSTDAKAKYEVGVADIQSRAAADPDFNNADKYKAELAKLKETTIKGVSNGAVKNGLAMEFNHGNQIAEIKIGAGFQAKQMEYNKVQVATNLDALEQKKLSASTPAEAAHIEGEIKNLLEAQVASGVLTYAEADKALKDAQKTAVKYEIYADNSTKEEDSLLLKELKDPKGKYSYLDPNTRLSMIEESQRRIFQNNQTFKRESEASKNERFNNIFQKANEGTLTLNDLDVELQAAKDNVPGAMSQKEILNIRDGIMSRVKTDLEIVTDNDEKANQYLTFVDNFIDSESDRQKGREAIAAAYKDGVLSDKEASLLNSIKRETEDIQWNRETATNNMIPFKNAIRNVGDFFRGKKHSTDAEAAIAIKKLLAGVSGGEKIDAAVERVKNEYNIEKNPELLNVPESGAIYMDIEGNLKILKNVDGKIVAEDYKESSNGI
jgi:hypothetical protein